MTDSVESVLQKSREEFEKWMNVQNIIPDYAVSGVKLLWEAWQASRSALEPMLAELSEGQHLLKVIGIAEEYDSTMSLLFHQENGKLSVAADCSDCFCWGCADAEEITPENVELYRQTLEECEKLKCVKGHASVFSDELFAARVRKMRPQGASYDLYPPEMWPLFDACGPERITGVGNPKEQPKRPEDAKGWNQPRRVTEKEWQQRAEAAEQALREAQAIFEHDRSIVADGVTRIKKALDSRHWLTEGRGPYEWDDDRWHSEFAAAGEELLEAIEPLVKLAADLKNSPTKMEDVIAARADWRAENEKLRALLRRSWETINNFFQDKTGQIELDNLANEVREALSRGGNCGLPLEANETEEMCQELSDRAATTGKGEQG